MYQEETETQFSSGSNLFHRLLKEKRGIEDGVSGEHIEEEMPSSQEEEIPNNHKTSELVLKLDLAEQANWKWKLRQLEEQKREADIEIAKLKDKLQEEQEAGRKWKKIAEELLIQLSIDHPPK